MTEGGIELEVIIMRFGNSRSLLLVSIIFALILLGVGTAVTMRALGRIGEIERTSRDLDDRELRFTSRFRSQIFSLQSVALKAQLRKDGRLTDDFHSQWDQIRLFLEERRALFTEPDEKLRYAQLTDRLERYGKQLAELVAEAADQNAGTPQERLLGLREALVEVNERLSATAGDTHLMEIRLRLQQAYSAAVVVMFDRRESARPPLITALAEARGTLSNAKHAGTLGPAEEAERIQNLANSFLMLAEKCLDEKSLAAAVDPRLQLENFEALGETRDGLTELATQLGDTRRDAFQEKLQRYRASAESLRWLMASLLGLLGLALAGAATLVYRAVVLPMKGRLNSAEESMRAHENLVALGTLAAGLAHEIRNPLTAIKARLFALGELIDKDSPAENQTRVIKREIERLEQTVQDFLDYAKPKAPNPVSTALQPYLEDLRTLVLPEMREREIGFSLGDPTELKVMMDREQVTQVMLNLIRNAEEACKPGDRIVVTSSEHEGKVRLSVMDNGPGIPVEHRERVFEPFFSNKKGGTGLGLAICRTIAVAHRGNLEFETETGRGTTFYFDLPRTV